MEEAAEAVDRLEEGKNVETTPLLDYTSKIEREYQDREKQLKDKLGYELADIGIFTIKTSTALETGIGNEDKESYSPDFEGLADTVESHNPVRPENTYSEAVRELEGLLEPGENQIVEDSPDEERIAEGLEQVLYGLSDLAADLPRSFEQFVSEKIAYNQKKRDPSDIDSSAYDES
ncbi:MAG: hypothetical protein ABEJ87_03100 [Candidatus Nanohalobium sp.]